MSIARRYKLFIIDLTDGRDFTAEVFTQLASKLILQYISAKHSLNIDQKLNDQYSLYK